MKEVKIQTLKLKYFKGIKELTVDFNQRETFIMGDNATGKTSIFDAFTWLLFGKDSLGQKTFEIKTLNADNTAIPQVDHEVEGELYIDGRKITLRKVYREIWGKTKGEPEVKLLRDETVCYWDGLEILVGEYNRRIADIVSEDLFKVITDPAYFNRLNTNGKREFLISLAGTISMADIARERPDLEEIIRLVNGYDINDEKAKAAAERKRMQDELKLIPGRIDTAHSLMPEKKDWNAIKETIQEREINIKELEAKIQDITSVGKDIQDKANQIIEQIGECQQRIMRERNEARLEADKFNNGMELEAGALRHGIRERESFISNTKYTIDSKQTQIDRLNSNNNQLREQWTAINEAGINIDPNAYKCPTCGREYDHEHTAEIQQDAIARHNAKKVADLESINNQGTANTARIEKLTAEIAALNIEIETAITERDALAKKLIDNQNEPRKTPGEIETTEIEVRIQELNAELAELKNSNQAQDTSGIYDEIRTIRYEIDQMNRELGAIDQIEKTEKELASLENRQRELSQKIAELEKKEYQIAELGKIKLAETERRVNEKFKIVQFRLFKFLKNGGEEPVCDAMVNGVPFDSLNTASRINAGIDIINALCEHHNIKAPIFIDNRETINDLIQSESQIINLVVTRDKRLIIN